ncbi:MAG: hypothetical protein WBF81_00325 [Thermoplasmata archaeon]
MSAVLEPTPAPTPGPGSDEGSRAGTPENDPRPGWATQFSTYLGTRDGASWAVAVFISGAISIGLAVVIFQYPIPPGGDPGTWLSTSYAYIGRSYPSQVFPLAYPPVMFVPLGLAVLVGGGPIGGAQLFAPLLYFALGLSIFALAINVLKSRLVALVVLSFIVLDPQLLQMVFWGAYPNLFGFLLMNLAFVGLLTMGRGAVSRGALIFWLFATLTVLTHSLTALVLAGGTGLFLLLAWAMPVPSTETLVYQAKRNEVDVPKVIPRGLFFTKGGRYGFVGFVIAVSAYYFLTALAHVPHPDYFVSSALAFRTIGLGGVLTAVLPGILIVALGAVYVLTVLVIVVLLTYSGLYLYRLKYLTTPVLLLIAIGVVVLTVPIIGWMFKIVTDYRRFGYFLLIPLGLTFGYIIDRGWISAGGPRERGRANAASNAPPMPPTVRRWMGRARHPRRIISLALIAFVLTLLLAVSITAPEMNKYEITFTRVGHDQYFLDALSAITHSGLPGGILTVAGADKWARAITGRNAFAPYTQTDYLFYESQILDSELAYYALNYHYAVTNGLVSAGIKGTQAQYTLGIPSYGIYSVGTYRSILKIPPQMVEVELIGATNHTAYHENMTTNPTVDVPPTSGGGPLEVVYTESDFVFTESMVVAPTTPYLYLAFHVQATGADLVRALNMTLLPSNTTSARILPTPVAGNFSWDTVTANIGPLTRGNVTPASALVGITQDLPITDLTGSPAVLLSYTSASTNGSLSVAGQLTLTTPAASTIFNVVPPVIDTPQIFTQLGVGFVLMRNSTYPPIPAPGAAYPQEASYYQAEYGAQVIYQNPEWTVLTVP